MTMPLYTPSGSTGLLNRLAALFRAAEGLEPLLSGGGLAAGMGAAAAAERAVIRYCEENGRITPSAAEALRALVDDCRAAGYYFTGTSQTTVVTPGASNISDAAIVWIDRNADGDRVMIYPETLRLIARTNGIKIDGQRRIDRTASDWPAGSETSLTRAAATIGQSVVRNGDFETLDQSRAAEWLVRTGSWDTTISLTQPEVQQITITGAPTGGYWYLTWTDPLGRGWCTPTLPHNATASQVQAAVRTIPLLRAAVVSGANPLSVVFENTPGNLSEMAAVSQLTGGTNPAVAVATTTNGDPLSYRGRSLKLTGSAGNEQTCLWQPIALEADAVYAVAVRARRTASASGTLRIELRRGIDGAVVANPMGGLNRIETAVTTIAANGHSAITGSFRLSAADAANPLALTIHLSTPLPSGESIALDEMFIGKAARLYDGGPYLTVVAGWKPLVGDQWTIEVADSQVGAWERCFDRWLRLRERADVALPTSGSTLIADSMITG